MSRTYLKSTVLLTTVFLLCCATLALADGACGSWTFDGWTRSGTVQWTTDGNGDPSPSVDGTAVEHATWSDPCEGTPKDPLTASHGYSVIIDHAVSDSEDGQSYREVTYSASSSFGGPDNVITGSHALPRHWSTPSAIDGGDIETPEDGTFTLLPGETVGLSVTEATDEDTWTMWGGASDTEPDAITYAWTGGGTFIGDTTSRSAQWQAPQSLGTYNITVTIDDAPAQVTAPDLGSRDDSSVSRTFTIKVVPKVWDEGLAIGNARLQDDTSIEDGRMVLPQDQTSETPSPAQVKVLAGRTLDLSVEAATDSDHWIVQDTDREGYEDDTVTYTWSAPSGDIVGNANQRNAKWKAPLTADTYTLTCTIDDTPKAIGTLEQGTRDDSATTRTVSVEVVSGESFATLKLYKDEALTEEVDGDAIGGTAYIVLEVKLGAGKHLVSSSATLRVEENYPQHSEASRRSEGSISFGSGWYKKDANGEWQTSGTPQSTNETFDDEYFRKVWSWDTATTPLGHNETHTIKLVKVDGGDDVELTFAPETGDGEIRGPNGISADVKNLVITEAKSGKGNEDYVIYDPSENSQFADPKVTFKFEDEGGFQEGDEYRWTVWLAETDDQTNDVKTGTAPEPGSITANLNPPFAGVFGFNVWIKHYRNGISLDETGYRSLLVKFADDDLTVNDNDQFEFEYHIAPTESENNVHDLSEVKITMLAGDWSEDTQTSGPKTLNPLPAPAYTVILPDPSSEEPGEGRVILTGVDDEGITYRDHKNRRVSPKNDVGPRTYYLLTGGGPDLATVDSGYLSPLLAARIQLSGGMAARLLPLSLNTHQSPEAIWQRLAGIKRSNKKGGGTFQHALVTTSAHSTQVMHYVSTLPGGSHPAGGMSYAIWSVGNGLTGDYSVGAPSTPHLNGVSFYNMMGCNTAQASAPDVDHVATAFNPISQVVSHQKGAGNSMGYQTQTWYGTARGSVSQIWYRLMFSPSSLKMSDASESGKWVEEKYKETLIRTGIGQLDTTNPQCSSCGATTVWWGFDTWVVTNHNPILNR